MLNISEKSENNVADDTDYIGGGGFLWDSGVYTAKITKCYGEKKPSGSMCITFEFEKEDGKKLFETHYFLSKNGSFYYTDKKTGKNKHIPGFSRCAGIIATAFSDEYKKYINADTNGVGPTKLNETFFEGALASMEKGSVSVYDFDARRDMVKEFDFVMHKIVGKIILIAVKKIMVNKKAKNDKGDYVATAETKKINEQVLEFDIDGFSALELRTKAEKPESIEKWKEVNNGKLFDETDKTITPTSTGMQQSNEGKQTENIFDVPF